MSISDSTLTHPFSLNPISSSSLTHARTLIDCFFYLLKLSFQYKRMQSVSSCRWRLLVFCYFRICLKIKKIWRAESKNCQEKRNGRNCILVHLNISRQTLSVHMGLCVNPVKHSSSLFSKNARLSNGSISFVWAKDNILFWKADRKCGGDIWLE